MIALVRLFNQNFIKNTPSLIKYANMYNCMLPSCELIKFGIKCYHILERHKLQGKSLYFSIAPNKVEKIEEKMIEKPCAQTVYSLLLLHVYIPFSVLNVQVCVRK